VALLGLHHVHLRVRSLSETRSFAKDFGLREATGVAGPAIYLHGAGAGAYQLVLEAAEESSLAGLAFSVESRADLERAIAKHGASPVRALQTPGGGEAVTLTDPEGTSIHLVFGVATRAREALQPAITINQGPEKTRRGEAQYQPPLEPPQLLRLGHVGLFVSDFKVCEVWYREVLGLVPSDVMYAGVPQNLVAGFYRIDRGSEWVDHHTIALFGFGKSDLHHLSFEVQNPDTQFIAHRWLEKQGHKSIWGVGRHPKGSHVFDVWRDPSGYRFETFSDTDLLTADAPPGLFEITTMEMDLWSNRSHQAYFE
jgi:catechol 2,3-dioxygenase-like lactoylglutathione lyase family enzyme